MKIKLSKLFKSIDINIFKIIVIIILMCVLFSIINYINSLEHDSVEMFIDKFNKKDGHILNSNQNSKWSRDVNQLLGEVNSLTNTDKQFTKQSQDKKKQEQKKQDIEERKRKEEIEKEKYAKLSKLQQSQEDITRLKQQLEEQRILEENRKLEDQRKLEEQRKLEDQHQLEEQSRILLSENDRKIKTYTEYPGILQMGENIIDFTSSKTIPNAINGCINNINLTDSINKCDNATDCNSFFSYNPKGEGRVCFKNNSSSNSKHIPVSAKYKEISSFYIKNYKKYPGTLQMGEFPKQFVGSKLGCQLLGFEDAKKTCNNANDCNSFFSYNGDNEGEGRVCFKNNSKPINTHKPHLDPKYKDKSAFFVKN